MKICTCAKLLNVHCWTTESFCKTTTNWPVAATLAPLPNGLSRSPLKTDNILATISPLPLLMGIGMVLSNPKPAPAPSPSPIRAASSNRGPSSSPPAHEVVILKPSETWSCLLFPIAIHLFIFLVGLQLASRVNLTLLNVYGIVHWSSNGNGIVYRPFNWVYNLPLWMIA